MTATLIESLHRSFRLYDDLVAAIDEPVLGARLPGIPSNALGLQLWCVVGGRESYGRAIAANRWTGFSCSLDEPTNAEDVEAALRSSAATISQTLDSLDEFTDERQRFIVDLLEHEAAHQGQLIRYIYALRLAIPESWRAKYGLIAIDHGSG